MQYSGDARLWVGTRGESHYNQERLQSTNFESEKAYISFSWSPRSVTTPFLTGLEGGRMVMWQRERAQLQSGLFGSI
jgi:hypothetical protein